ncbi:MAG: hypothetical protein KatS3mg043_1370 [Rhodothermaceae bacterium]|nr:MAG: hypothetical protein KatS3mg043_1370 [Rhodothermaceae bacterium]
MQIIALDPAVLDDLRAAIRQDLEEVLRPDARTAEARNPDPLAYISNAEAMRLLGVSRATLQRWRDSGELPYARVGSMIFYRREDLEAFIGRHLVGGRAER